MFRLFLGLSCALCILPSMGCQGTGCRSCSGNTFNARMSGLLSRGCRSGDCANVCGDACGGACGKGGCGNGYGVHPLKTAGFGPHPGQHPQAQPAGPPVGQYGYPYYTLRGPRDFLQNNPPSIGPY
jgi:hypothetical protein